MFDPNPKERVLVGRCLLEQHVLIGSVDEIWTHPWALEALGTLRLCVDAIRTLVEGQHTVTASFVKAVVIQSNDLERSPPFLDEVAEFMVGDREARQYWDALMPDDRHPHRCPWCGSSAYVGFNVVECKAGCR